MRNFTQPARVADNPPIGGSEETETEAVATSLIENPLEH